MSFLCSSSLVTRGRASCMVVLLLGACQTHKQANNDGDARIMALEERVTRLEVLRVAVDEDEQALLLRIELDALRQTFSADHPEVLRLQAQLSALEDAQTERRRATCERVLHKLHAERDYLVKKYEEKHPAVVSQDRKIASAKTALEELEAK